MGDLPAHNVLPRAPWKTTADHRGTGKWNRGNRGPGESSTAADTEAEKTVGPFGGLVVGADGGIKILIAFWRDFVKGAEQACGFSHNGQYNGGEAWRGKKGPAWGSMLEGRKLTRGTCFHTHCLQNGGYKNSFKDRDNTDITSNLGGSYSLRFDKFTYFQFWLIAEMKGQWEGKLQVKQGCEPNSNSLK